MSWIAPNLAHRPFENLRPVRRIAGTLAVLAAALTVWNVLTWLRTGAGAAERAAELARLSRELDAAQERATTLEEDLARHDLERDSERVEFLNDLIGARVFSWNHLLAHLAEVLPPEVRVLQLSPTVESATTSRSNRRRPTLASGEAIELQISAVAATDGAFLEFLDALFASPRFGAPDLASEARRQGGEIQFELAVAYRPSVAIEAAAEITVADDPQGDTADEEIPTAVTPVSTDDAESEEIQSDTDPAPGAEDPT